MPCPAFRSPSGADISYMEQLLAEIETAGDGPPCSAGSLGAGGHSDLAHDYCAPHCKMRQQHLHCKHVVRLAPPADALPGGAPAGFGAPAPIEQRWCSRSRSAMSPAAALDPDAVTSWVGIIMYLPEDGDSERAAITARCTQHPALSLRSFAAVPCC
jgi:hypothetical protein